MKEANFKETEIGKIPVDWEIKSIGDSFIFKNGLNKEKKFFGYGFPIVNYMDVYRNSGICNQDIQGKVFLNSTELKSFEVKKGDVLFTRTSETPEEIGLSAVILDEVFKTTFSGFLLRARPINELFDLNFCKYCFDNNAVRMQIKSKSTYTTRALTNGRVLSNIQIPLPPLSEQEKIAEVLSDTDFWIESTEALLAKKRQIKKGAMQKLLSPKEDWEVRKLGEVAEYRRGSFPQPYGLEKWYDEHNGMPFVQVFDVAKNMKLKSTTKQRISDLAKNYSVFVAKGNLVLTIQGSIGRIALTQYDSYVDRTLLIFTNFKIPMDKVFFMYKVYELFQIEKIKAPGGTIKTITKEELSAFIFHFPKSLKTQQEIAEILSSMDLEIESLENRLQKARQLKQGMMQDLLTGKVRLVD